MRSITENRSLAKAAGALGLVGHLAAAILYILVPGLAGLTSPRTAGP